MLEENELDLNSVLEISPLWREQCGEPLVEKLIRLQNGMTAIILKEDCNKPLRFLYLVLFMSKKNASNMNILMSKLGQIKSIKKKLVFLNKGERMDVIGNKSDRMHELLRQLENRLQKMGWSPLAILKLCLQYGVVDALLIMVLRAVADDYKMTNALDCTNVMGLGQIEILMNKFFVDKNILINNKNKYIIFWTVSEVEVQYFRSRGVIIQKQAECYEELSDSTTVRYEEFVMIEKIFSLL